MRLLCEAVASRGLRLVFLFDEFECVTKNGRIGPEHYSFLRSLANNFPVSFVTASGRDLKDMCVTHEISDSPFFNIFSVQHVGLFQRQEAEELIRTPSEARGIPLAPLSDAILEMGGLYPFFLQMACAAWFDSLEAEGAKAEEFAGKQIPRDVHGVVPGGSPAPFRVHPGKPSPRGTVRSSLAGPSGQRGGRSRLSFPREKGLPLPRVGRKAVSLQQRVS